MTFVTPTTTRQSRSTRRLLLAVALWVLWTLDGATAGLEPPARTGRATDKSAPPATHPSRAAQGRDLLSFRNGDRLTGALLSIDLQNGVRWRHPDASEIIQFNPAYIAAIQFPPRQSATPQTPDTCRVRLENGDELRGDVTFAGGDSLAVETAYAGRLELPRNQVRLLTPVPAPAALIYSGPTGTNGWTFGKVVAPMLDAGAWGYTDGAFYATDAASVARDVKLPDRASVQFDLAWTSTLQLAVALYTDYLQPINLFNRELEPRFGEFYSLQLYGGRANLVPVKQQSPLPYLGAVDLPVVNRKSYAHFELRVDKPRRLVALLVDNVLAKVWVDPEPFTGHGTAVRFVHSGAGAIQLSHLRITAWDGELDVAPIILSRRADDLARLRNGDKAVGHLESIRDGQLTIAAAGTRLRIPLSRVRHIELADGEPRAALRGPLHVVAFLADGSHVTFQLGRWDREGVAATSPVFGKAVFDPSAFTRLEFQPEPASPASAR